MELDTIKLADLLEADCRVVLFCKRDSVIHGIYDKGGKGYICEPVRFSSRAFSPSMLMAVRRAVRKYDIKNVIFFGASELKTLYFSFTGFDLNVIVRHGTTKSTPKRGYIHRLVYSCVNFHVALSRHLLNNVKTIVPAGGKVDFRIITPSFVQPAVCKHMETEGMDRVLHIVHVGRVAKGKGQIEAVLACNELAKNDIEFRLDLLGGYQDQKYLDRLKAAIRESGLQDHVVLRGHVDNVGDYMDAADIFLFPSYGEGMPNALIEALHHGHVCLCFSNTVFPEFGEMGFYIVLARDRDQVELAEKLLGIAQNIVDERRKSEKNTDLALEYFNRDREKRDWLSILQ